SSRLRPHLGCRLFPYTTLFRSARSTFDELAVMDIAGAQLLFGRLGRLDRIDLVTDPARPVEEVRRAILALLPPELTAKRPQQRRSEEHTSELQSRFDLVCRLLL